MAMVMIDQRGQPHPAALCPGPRHLAASLMLHDEYRVDFDRYMIVYGDDADCTQDELARRSPITALMLGHNGSAEPDERGPAGGTTIGCYKGDRFVGCMNFYRQSGGHPQSAVNAEGLVSLWYPLACFPHILDVLHHEKNLSLSLVCNDLAGRDMVPPMGALLTWPEPAGKESEREH